MAKPDALHVEMALGEAILDMTDDPILDMTDDPILDSAWVDVQDDVLTEAPIKIFQGQRNGDLLERVADIGSITLLMNNNPTNSGGVVGYYSPDHGNRLSGFANGLKVRVGITKDAVQEWFTQGKIVAIDPMPGLLNNKTVQVMITDWIETASREGSMPSIGVQEGVTDDQVIQLIVDAMEDKPTETDLNVGAYTYDYALTDVEDGKESVLGVLQRLAQCGLGRIFITGGATSGEILTYVDLYSLLTSAEAVASFNDDQIEMGASRKAGNRVRNVNVTVYPMIKDAAAVTLFTLPQELAIPGGGEVEIRCFFRDPNGSSSRSIPAVEITSPIVGSEIQFSSTEGAGSGDLNSSLSVTTFTPGSRSAYIKMKNNGGTLGYLQLDIEGKGLYPYDSLSYSAVDASIRQGEGVNVDYDLPYHGDYYTGKEIADNLLTWYSPEMTEAPSIFYTPSLDEDAFDKLMVSKPGKIVNVSESVTGFAYAMIVVGREIEIWNGGGYITERLFITPAAEVESGLYFTLDTLGQDDLDGPNTILAFG
jgi:hypothetical protein